MINWMTIWYCSACGWSQVDQQSIIYGTISLDNYYIPAWLLLKVIVGDSFHRENANIIIRLKNTWDISIK